MNKHELIKEVKEIGIYGLNIFGTVVEGIPTKTTIELIKQLDEPEKVKVPQFVAEHIEWAKKEDFHLLGAMNRENFDKKLEAWFYTDDNMELFARAWLDGYEVEKEKRYCISMPKARNYKNHAQILCEKDGKIFWCGEWYPFRTKFTRKQLEEADFGWVFDCEGVEIEEVEE